MPILPDGATVIICGRGRASKACVVCGRSAGLLCDFPLTGPKAGQTCDRALCAVHTFRPRAGVDFCPAHAAMVTATDGEAGA